MRVVLAALAIPLVATVASATPNASPPAATRTSGQVQGLSADGPRAAAMIAKRGGRSQVVVWEPSALRTTPLPGVGNASCSRFYCGPTGDLALSGARVAWGETYFGNALETYLQSATLSRRAPRQLGGGNFRDGIGGSVVLAPAGDRGLLAFTLEVRCGDPSDEDTPCPPGRRLHDVVSATVWRAAPRGRCPFSDLGSRPGHCARVARAEGELTVLAVDAGRIAARTDDGVRLMTGVGRRLRDLPVENVRSAALSGNQLALRVPDAFEIYDTRSGERITSVPAQGSARLDRLQDLARGILVTAKGRTVTLRRLRDDKTLSIQMSGVAFAQIEPAGLYVAGGRRMTFTPMADVLRRLG